MKACLLFLSSLIIFCIQAISLDGLTLKAYETKPLLPAEYHDQQTLPVAGDAQSEKSIRKSFEILTDKGAVTGILIIRKEDDGRILGSMINEFGVSAIDFICNDGKVKLTNVIGFLDKWYIRKVLATDIGFCLHKLCGINLKGKPHNYSVNDDGNTLKITNLPRKITYSFQPLPTD